MTVAEALQVAIDNSNGTLREEIRNEYLSMTIEQLEQTLTEQEEKCWVEVWS